MAIEGWTYYNHAMIPTTPPHSTVNLDPIVSKRIWHNNKTAILARYTTDWDCGHETNWWYVIKDKPFDISELKSKRRYEIKKGNKNFNVMPINPWEMREDIFRVTYEAYKSYPDAYRPIITHDKFVDDVNRWNFYRVYGAFSKEDESLCGYACLRREGNYIDFCMMKAVPDKERLGINAAMVNKLLLDHESFLNSDGYICDGARSIQHETAFQDYLEKYFGFRKAYCHLHIVYRPLFRIIINCIYPLRNQLANLNSIKIFKQINSIILMEELIRKESK